MLKRSGPAPMAVWSKALPLNASCLLPLPGFESYMGHVKKLLVTRRGFLHCIQLASHNLAAIWQNK